MINLLNVTIAKVDGPVFSGPVVSITVPGIEGEMTLLADHEAIISPLQVGTITVTTEAGTKETFEVTTGTLELSDNHLTILI